MKNRKKRVQHVQHLIVCILLLITAAERLDNYPVSGVVISILGFSLLGYFFYGLIKKKENANLQILAHLCDCIALVFTVYIFFSEGKIFLPYIILMAALGYFISAKVLFRRNKRKINALSKAGMLPNRKNMA